MNEPNPEESIFAAARQLPPAERAAYLAQATEGDATLRRRIEALLNASEQSGAFLEVSAAPTLRRAPAASILLAEKPGDKVGRYKLLQQIGEGGCGVVYMAEQEEPVRRRVALKIIKLGMDTKSVIARFEAERQALAMMDHPNIAKVFDAGATETGRPYFVMELVRGVKITDYCDEAKLSIRARLDLFMQVCHAIQHAHQKGIIHRDIKPSNILVTVNDGVPVPKVIDFGIVKATGGQLLTDKTIFTAFEQFIGTPAYMSPEQAVMTSLDIDTRSDIYALGVLLYELLTGRTPFDAGELLAAGLDEMRRTIREQEPARPSTCLSTMPDNELSTTAQRRGLDAPKLVSQLRGDLDWIVMKCVEKDRSRRYETANGLAAEIQRHLNNEPVIARPPSKFYEFQKTVRRHKFGFAATAAVILVLAAGVIASTIQTIRARRAEHSQMQLRQEAETSRANETKLREQAEASRANEAKLRQEAEAARANEAKLLQEAQTARTNEMILRQATEYQLKVTDANGLFYGGKPKDAENLLDRIQTELVELPRESMEARRQLGWEFAKEGHWVKAVPNLAAAVQNDDPEWDAVVSGDHFNYSVAMVVANDLAAYNKYRQNLVADLSRTNDLLASVCLCQNVLLAPADPAFMQSLEPFIIAAKAWNGKRDYYYSNNNAHTKSTTFYMLALVAYRNGDYTNALTLADACVAIKSTPDPVFTPRAQAIGAMAHFRMGQVSEGNADLLIARRVVDAALKKRVSSTSSSAEEHWFEWQAAEILIKEAEKLMSDPAVTRELLLKAAEQHQGWAEYQLGVMYQHGDGVATNASEAAKWFLKAAEDGQPKAQPELIRIYKTGDGAPKNDAEALKWQRKVVESKDPTELNEMAWLLATSPLADVRDGKLAVTLAEQAVALTSRTNASVVDTLAAAYAESGDFQEAVATEKESIIILQMDNDTGDYGARLKLYESNTPCRDPAQ